MSTENVKGFLAAVKGDAELREKFTTLQAAGEGERFVTEVVALGAEKGYAFTGEELIAVCAEASAEVGDEELEAVAGGGSLENPLSAFPYTTTHPDGMNVPLAKGLKELLGQSHTNTP